MSEFLYGNPCNYNGLKVVENPMLTVAGEPYEKKITIKERFFSLQWRPLKKTRTIVPKVPSREVVINGDTVYCHPSVAIELKRQLFSAI